MLDYRSVSNRNPTHPTMSLFVGTPYILSGRRCQKTASCHPKRTPPKKATHWIYRHVPPGKLTCWTQKWRFGRWLYILFIWEILRFHVKFQGCSIWYPTSRNTPAKVEPPFSWASHRLSHRTRLTPESGIGKCMGTWRIIPVWLVTIVIVSPRSRVVTLPDDHNNLPWSCFTSPYHAHPITFHPLSFSAPNRPTIPSPNPSSSHMAVLK